MSKRLRTATNPGMSFFAFQDIIASVTGVLILVTLILASHIEKLTDNQSEQAPEQLRQKLSRLLEEQAKVEIATRTLAESLMAAQNQPDAPKLSEDIAQLKTRLAGELAQLGLSKAETERQRIAAVQLDARLGLSDIRSEADQALAEAAVLGEKEREVRLEKEKLEAHLKRAEASLAAAKSRKGNLWLIPDDSITTKEPILAIVSREGVTLERFDKPESRRSLKSAGSFSAFSRFLSENNPRNQYIVFYVRPSGISLFNQLSEQAKDNKFEIGFDAMDENTKVHFTKPPGPEESAEPLPPPPSAQKPAPVSAAVSNTGPSPQPLAVTQSIASQLPKSTPAPLPTPPENLNWWQKLLRAIGLY